MKRDQFESYGLLLQRRIADRAMRVVSELAHRHAGMQVVMPRCGEDMTPETSRNYLKAFDEAFVRLVGF